MWEDQEFNDKIRAEFEVWLAQGPDMPTIEEYKERELERKAMKRKHSRREVSKYKGRGKFENRS